MEQAETPQAVRVELPRGRYPGRLDDKGRLKLAATFQEFFKNLPEKKIFVSSLDRETAVVYPIADWRVNEERFEGDAEDTQALSAFMFNANDLGAETEMDSQGRILFNSDLRKELGLEGTELHLSRELGHITVMTQKTYEERRLRVKETGMTGDETFDKLKKLKLR